MATFYPTPPTLSAKGMKRVNNLRDLGIYLSNPYIVNRDYFTNDELFALYDTFKRIEKMAIINPKELEKVNDEPKETNESLALPDNKVVNPDNLKHVDTDMLDTSHLDDNEEQQAPDAEYTAGTGNLGLDEAIHLINLVSETEDKQLQRKLLLSAQDWLSYVIDNLDDKTNLDNGK